MASTLPLPSLRRRPAPPTPVLHRQRCISFGRRRLTFGLKPDTCLGSLATTPCSDWRFVGTSSPPNATARSRLTSFKSDASLAQWRADISDVRSPHQSSLRRPFAAPPPPTLPNALAPVPLVLQALARCWRWSQGFCQRWAHGDEQPRAPVPPSFPPLSSSFPSPPPLPPPPAARAGENFRGVGGGVSGVGEAVPPRWRWPEPPPAALALTLEMVWVLALAWGRPGRLRKSRDGGEGVRVVSGSTANGHGELRW